LAFHARGYFALDLAPSFTFIRSMSINPADVASASPQPTAATAPPPSSGARLIVLLALLGLVIAAYGYDYGVARPAVDAAEKKVNDFVDASNRLGVKEGSPVTPDAIHKELGMQPTFVEKHPDEHYEVEYYCWWGRVPVLNLRRHYLSLVYIGDEPRRFSSHHKNEPPPREALPIPEKIEPTAEDEAVPPPQSPGEKRESKGEKKTDSDGAPPAEAPPSEK
jgi:hypothetical protein